MKKKEKKRTFEKELFKFQGESLFYEDDSGTQFPLIENRASNCKMRTKHENNWKKCTQNLKQKSLKYSPSRYALKTQARMIIL